MNISSIGNQIRFKQNTATIKVKSTHSNKAITNAEPKALKINMLKIITGIYTNEEVEHINTTRLLPVGTKLVSNYGPGTHGGSTIRPILPTDSQEQRYLPNGYSLKRIFGGAALVFKNQPN